MRKLPLKKEFETDASTSKPKKKIKVDTRQVVKYAFRQTLIDYIGSLVWLAIQFSGRKAPDFDKGEIYSLPFEVDVKIENDEFKMRTILIEPDGTIFLRDENSDIGLFELSTNDLVKLSGMLNEYILKTFPAINE